MLRSKNAKMLKVTITNAAAEETRTLQEALRGHGFMS